MLCAMARASGARAARPRIHPLVPVVVALVVTGALVVVVAALSGDDAEPAAVDTTTTTAPATTTELPTTTTTTPPDPVAVAPLLAEPPEVDAPSTYRITYDVVENGLGRVETRTVRRPYESLVESRRDGVQVQGTATSRTHLRTFLSDRSGWLTIQPELHRAAFDLRPAAALAAMDHLGYVEEIGAEEHAGRTCTVYRTGQPPSSERPTAPSDDESTDVCIDGAGLVLHERWQLGGSTVTERTATSVETGIDVDPAIFDPTPEIEDAEEFEAAFQSVAVEADEETRDRLETSVEPPPGYTADATIFRASSTGRGPSNAEIVRFYSDGRDLLEVSEQSSDGPVSLGGGGAVLVEGIAGWDEVWFAPGFRTSSVRTRLSESSFLELRHHDVALLFEMLETRVQVAG